MGILVLKIQTRVTFNSISEVFSSCENFSFNIKKLAMIDYLWEFSEKKKNQDHNEKSSGSVSALLTIGFNVCWTLN